MTCLACEAIQELRDYDSPGVFVRVEDANVEIVACSEHARLLIEAMRKVRNG